MPRKNDVGVEEVASIRTDLNNYGEGHERIFGTPEKKFCDECDKRLSFCECEKKEEEDEQN